EEEDAEWEKEQRQLQGTLRANQPVRETVGVLNQDALREAIPWYSGPNHSRATTLFEMRELADRIMSFFDGSAAQSRGPRLRELGERLQHLLRELIDGYGREAQPGALEGFGRLTDAIEKGVGQFDSTTPADDLQALNEFQVACAGFCDKLRALHRLYPCRRLL